MNKTQKETNNTHQAVINKTQKSSPRIQNAIWP